MTFQARLQAGFLLPPLILIHGGKGFHSCWAASVLYQVAGSSQVDAKRYKRSTNHGIGKWVIAFTTVGSAIEIRFSLATEYVLVSTSMWELSRHHMVGDMCGLLAFLFWSHMPAQVSKVLC